MRQKLRDNNALDRSRHTVANLAGCSLRDIVSRSNTCKLNVDSVNLFVIPLTSMESRLSITLESWLRTGAFGSLKIGDRASDVVQLLGDTEFFGPKSRTSYPAYWLYDEIEFGFDSDARIEWIQSDTVRISDARANPTVIDIDWQGVFHDMRLTECLRWLDRFALTSDHMLDDDGATITIEGRSEMLLTDPDDPKLVTIWSPARSR